jgi:hypothetical protein
VFPEPKASKQEAKYEPIAKHMSERCGICRFFEKPDGCKKVSGVISPRAWCKYFDRKSRG